MQPSRAQTYNVPDAAVSNTPAAVAGATTAPIRVLVRNIGGTLIMLGFAPEDVGVGGTGSAVYELPPGAVDAFVLAPKQRLYAMSIGVGGRICIAASQAVLTAG